MTTPLDVLASTIADVVAESGLPADTDDRDDEWDIGSDRDVAEYLADAFETMGENAVPPHTFDRPAFIGRACGWDAAADD